MKAAHSVREHLLKEFPFPVQRIQSDHGCEELGCSSKMPCARNASSSALTDHEHLTSTAKSNAPRKLTVWEANTREERAGPALYLPVQVEKAPENRKTATEEVAVFLFSGAFSSDELSASQHLLSLIRIWVTEGIIN